MATRRAKDGEAKVHWRPSRSGFPRYVFKNCSAGSSPTAGSIAVRLDTGVPDPENNCPARAQAFG